MHNKILLLFILLIIAVISIVTYRYNYNRSFYYQYYVLFHYKKLNLFKLNEINSTLYLFSFVITIINFLKNKYRSKKKYIKCPSNIFKYKKQQQYINKQINKKAKMNFYTKRNNTDFYTVYYKYLKKSKQKQKTKLKKSYETPELKRGSCPYCHGTDHQRITSKDCLYYGIPLQQVKAIIKDNKTNANKRIREIEIDNDMNLTSSAKRSKHTSPTIQTLLSPNLQPQIQTQSILTQPSTPVSVSSI